MAEGAPLLRAYTLIAYRGFESLLLRQKPKGSRMGPFWFLGDGGVDEPSGSTKRAAFGTEGSTHLKGDAPVFTKPG